MSRPLDTAIGKEESKVRSGSTSSQPPPGPPMTSTGSRRPGPGVPAPAGQRVVSELGLDRRALLVRQRERFGGMKIGSAFFGWLAATGLSVILLAALATVGVGVGAVTGTSANQAVQEAQAGTDRARIVGLVGGLVVLVILFVAFLAGAYVAGRMARFSGARQGLAVWLWGVVMAGLIALVAAVVGLQYDIIAQLNLPRFQLGEQTSGLATLIGIAAAAVVALVGAVLGGLAGMRFHRRVDRTEVLNAGTESGLQHDT